MPIPWIPHAVGAPVDAATGFGEPSLYMTENHVIPGSGTLAGPVLPWQQGATFAALYDAVVSRKIGDAELFTYSAAPTDSNTTQWYADFPGCDAAGDTVSGNKYGIVTVQLSFEVFQAEP